jgi:hypothetical protein
MPRHLRAGSPLRDHFEPLSAGPGDRKVNAGLYCHTDRMLFGYSAMSLTVQTRLRMTNSQLRSAQMARRGRRPKGEYPEKKRVFASRIREDTWEMLQRAAAKSGRSLSQEFEFRLRRSLDDDEKIESAFGDLKTFGLMELAAQAVKSMCDLRNLKVHWTANLMAFDEALEVINRTLKGFRPHELAATNLVMGPPELGTPALAEVVRKIQAADPTRPLGKVSKRERAMLRLQSELGDLADRPGRLLEAKHRKPKGRKTRSH